MVNIYFAGYGEAQALPLARRFRQFPLFFTAGFPIEQVPHRFMEFKKTALAQELDSIVVKSASMEESIAKFFGRKVTVIPNGVDASFFKAGNASVARLPNGFHEESANVILTVAALEERKGVQHVVAAIPALLAAHPTLRYLVVGDGPYRATLQAQVRGLGLERHVHFVGAVTDVRPYYAHADLFCLLSRGEGLPNALLEAWAMGLPVVVAQQPPFDAIVPSECGLTVRESDLTDVVKAIESLLGDEGRRKRMGDAGRRHVLAEYTWATVARRYLSMFGADSAT
jgi:glycogen(starch) synthase